MFSFLQTSGGELLAVAAFLNEGGFQGRNLAVQKKVCLMDDADECVGADRGVFVVKLRGVEFPALGVGEIGQIRLMRQISLIVPYY